MSKSVIIGVIAIIVILGGGYLLVHKKSTPTTSNNTSNSTSTNTTPSTSTDKTAAATITYSNNGFSPGSTTVKAGDAVAIKNTSSNELQLNSNPHPVHTDDSDLNVGSIAAGQSKTFVVNKVGTFGFHNHLNASDTGTITIQ